MLNACLLQYLFLTNGRTNERSRQAAGSKKAELEKRIEAKFKLDLTDSGFADFWDVLR